MEWMLLPLKRYAEFSGRSRRKEYWMFFLFIIIVSLVIGLIEGAMGLSDPTTGIGLLSGLFNLAILIPSIAVGVRRLHDTGRSGWWILLPLVPYVVAFAMLLTGSLAMFGTLVVVALLCGIVVLIFMVLPGTNGPNEYGPDPKGPDEEVFA